MVIEMVMKPMLLVDGDGDDYRDFHPLSFTAFFALMEHGIRAAPLWDSFAQDFVGMLTISDFITILQKYYRSHLSSKNDIKSHMIATWRDVLKNHNQRIAANKLISIGPDASLYEAIKTLHDAKVGYFTARDGKYL